MKIDKCNDWFFEMKTEINDLVLLFKMLKEEFLIMLLTNSWILTDINLADSFSKIKGAIDISNSDMDVFIEKINMLDESANVFYVADLKDEFEFIKENIYLESSYITNMVKRMILLNLPYVSLEILEKLEEYQEIDIYCYNQIEFNNEGLKKLRKERRDYFE